MIVELMSISVYILVTGTFIIVCYNKKEREKRARERRKRDKREGREEWKVNLILEESFILVFIRSTLTFSVLSYS